MKAKITIVNARNLPLLRQALNDIGWLRLEQTLDYPFSRVVHSFAEVGAAAMVLCLKADYTVERLPEEQPAHAPTATLLWSERLPDAPGWYWYRAINKLPVAILVQFDKKENLRVFFEGGTLGQLVIALHHEGARWAGPIPSPVEKCNHKFVDSNSCLKCGWTPPD